MADIEALLIPWLASTLGVRFVTDVPADLAEVVPLGQVGRIGGPDDSDNPRFDLPTVAVDCFAADRASASTLAQGVHDALREQLPGTKLTLSTVTRVETVTGPSWRPWDDTSLRRYGATYRLHVKSSRP